MKAQSTPKVLAPQGTHIARVVGIIYMGTVVGEWQGKPKESYRLRMTWELPTEKHVFKEELGEQPFIVSKEMSLSMGTKSTLRPIIEGIIGVSLTDEEAYAFDIDEVLGKPCLISISYDESDRGKYVVIKNTAPLLKGVACPDQITPTKILSFEKWNEEYFKTLPSFITDKIIKTKEYRKMKGIEVEGVDDDISGEDLPF